MKYIGDIAYSLFDKKRIEELTPGWSLKKEGILSWDIMYATEVEEFYYKPEDPFNGKDEVVKEGDPIGFDVETKDGVELVLYDNIYWNPGY
tara:strand:+ start:250 stop:522 length:273 start_codon:yes stop_codon:yes gene_type:complete